MRKFVLQVKSTLTDRYQTTIPELIRESLQLGKRDKITYTIQKNGNVLISRADENDPVLGQFLTFIAHDIKNNPKQIQTINATLFERASKLTSNMKIDLDKPLNDEDD